LQLPQWLISVDRFVQTLLQAVCPLEHVTGAAQVPEKQDCPVGHTLPHAPQLLLSVCTVVHELLQYSWPFAQLVHFPFQQYMPLAPEQYVPQLPQLLESVCVLTQELPHQVVPVGHWQTPLV